MAEVIARVEENGTMMSLPKMKEQVRVLKELLDHIMLKNVHYGTIPGTQKPTLYKPGSEKILSTFRIAAAPSNIEDLSTEDEVRYRVTVSGTAQASGIFLGAGIGECSSDEEKYKWRKPVCEKEFEDAPIDRRREVWKKTEGRPYLLKQVRTNPKDVANTVLKMAKKRSQIDMTLTVTAASDVFDQDLEDLSPEVREGIVNGGEKKPPITPPQEKPKDAPPAEEATEEAIVSNQEGKMLYAKLKAKGFKSTAFMNTQIRGWYSDDTLELFKLPLKYLEGCKVMIDELPDPEREPGQEG